LCTRLHWAEHWPVRKIARHLHIGRRTIAKYLVAPAQTAAPRQRSSKLDPFKPTIAEFLEQDPHVRATVIAQRLRPLGFKMHTLLDLHGSIPTFIRITEGKTHDVNILDQIIPEAGSFYVMDRGYVDFERLHLFTLCSAFFVVRSKENILLQRRYSHPVDRSSGVRSDHTVILTASESAKVYPDALRRVTYFDLQNQKWLKFLTNNFFLPALTIAKIYKSRWMVELFFKFIKQHLRIKSFYGTRERGEDPDLDRGLHLRTGGDRPEAPATGSELLPNSTDFESHAFRENAHFTGLGSDRLP
jgi:hypothetical protein